MIMAGSSSCFPNGVPPPQNLQMYTSSHLEDMISSSIEATSAAAAASESASGNFLYNLSILKDKIHQVQSLANFFISPNDHSQQPYGSTAIAIASIGTLIQEIIVTATSVMYTCQQMAIGNNNNNSLADDLNTSGGSWGVKDLDPSSMNQDFNGNRVVHEERGQGFYMSESLDWCRNDGNKTAFNNTRNMTTRVSGNDNNNSVITKVSHKNNDFPMKGENLLEEKNPEGLERNPITKYDIVELNAADILAKYTHYCQVCGKGFKRDANLRMHMRAHGDEYKSNAALTNPVKNINREEGKADGSVIEVPRKYSCPHEGCRWNKKHAKFQPLKSMICVKNHYKRSHCPKMYVCKRCNRKQFSVLSDLRTHEKHCGDLKWQCSCGTTFSRKDKLMGHVTLFVGHTPAISSLNKMGKVD